MIPARCSSDHCKDKVGPGIDRVGALKVTGTKGCMLFGTRQIECLKRHHKGSDKSMAGVDYTTRVSLGEGAELD